VENEQEQLEEQQYYEAQLHQAIERLYDVFERYPLKDKIDACDHCVDPEDHERLRSKPLRELSVDDLEKYSFKAMTTWGEAEDFKHFLPRLFELIASDQGGFIAEWVIGWKLELAEWQLWPEAERDALRAYLAALWGCVVREYESRVSVDELLCYAARAGMDVRPCLEEWRAACRQSDIAAYHLADYIDTVVYRADQKITSVSSRDPLDVLLEETSMPPGEHESAAHRQIAAWLCEPPTGGALEQALRRANNGELMEQLTTALNQLAWLRSVPERIDPCW
jgi:hypothetical protein